MIIIVSSYYSAVSSLGSVGYLDSTWLVIILDVFEGPQTPRCTTTTLAHSNTTTENDAEYTQSFLQQVRKFLNDKKAERGREGVLFVGHTVAGLCCWSRSDQSNCGLISHRMHRRSSAGYRSKWELVHYGSAARYFTNGSEFVEDGGVVVTD